VRLFIGQEGDYEDCEVKVNGDLHEPSKGRPVELRRS
jgi:hypothetical protein